MNYRILLIFCLLALTGYWTADGAPRRSTAANWVPRQVKTTFSVRANIYFGDQDEEVFPLEDTEFYLLDESLVKILQAARFKPVFSDGKKHRATDEDYLEAAAQALTAPEKSQVSGEAEVIAFLIEDAIRKHRLSLARTNSFGRGYFKEIVPGNYYLFGIGTTDAEVFVWHLPVEIKSGVNFIEVDQNNAAVIFATDE